MIVSDRKNLDWNALAEEFYNMVKNSTPQTAVKVEVYQCADGSCDGINVYPAGTNYNNYICQLEEVVDFTRCKGLSSWADVEDGKIRIHIS